MSTEDRRVVRTKKAIAAAFRQLMQKQEFREISVNDVAAQAGISRTTFYHHYEDKYDWLETTIREALAKYTEGTHINDMMDRNIVIRNVTNLFRCIANDPQLCALIQANENHDLIYRFFWDVMMRQFQEIHGSAVRPSPTENLTAHYIAASLSAYIEWWVRNTGLFTPEELMKCIESFHKLP